MRFLNYISASKRYTLGHILGLIDLQQNYIETTSIFFGQSFWYSIYDYRIEKC